MKTKSLVALGVLVFSTTIGFAASNGADSDSKQLEIYPKNIARQNVGTNLFVFNPTNQNYVPTEAAAAWLDDDVATGWPPLPGKNHYLLSFTEPQQLTNFAISTKAGSVGTVTLYAGDEPAPPSSKSWTLIAKDVSVDSINDHKMSKPFSRVAKYLLIETNLTDPSPWYSVYVYGDKPALSYHLKKRDQSIDSRSVFGSFVNNQTMFNLSSIYADGQVVSSNMNDGATTLAKAIDDNPETSVVIAPSKDAGLTIHYSEARQIQRISVYCDPSAKGRLDFFLTSDAQGTTPSSVPAPAPVSKNDQGSHITKVANTTTATPDAAPAAGSLDKMTPTVSLVLDGSTGRGSIDFPPVTAANMIVRWTPETAGQDLAIREINSFGDLSLNDFELVSDAPSAVAEAGHPDFSKDESKDSKDKGAADPVGELLPGKDPFLPGPLGAPPNLPNVLSP